MPFDVVWLRYFTACVVLHTLCNNPVEKDVRAARPRHLHGAGGRDFPRARADLRSTGRLFSARGPQGPNPRKKRFHWKAFLGKTRPSREVRKSAFQWNPFLRGPGADARVAALVACVLPAPGCLHCAQNGFFRCRSGLKPATDPQAKRRPGPPFGEKSQGRARGARRSG